MLKLNTAYKKTSKDLLDQLIDLMVSLTDTPEVVARGIVNDVEEALSNAD